MFVWASGKTPSYGSFQKDIAAPPIEGYQNGTLILGITHMLFNLPKTSAMP